MTGLVAPGICRYTIQGSYSGRNVANILDMHIDQTGSISDRQDAIEDQAAIIISAWVDNIVENLNPQYEALVCSWVDLDTSSGSVGSATTGTGSDFPAAGTGSADAQPGNVAIRVNKQITAARGQRQGRMYLCGMSEANTATSVPNSPSGAYITALNADLATFLSAINQSAGVTPPNYDSWLSVVHTRLVTPDPPDEPYIEYVSRSHVNSLVCDPTLGSQRRRLRG